MKRLAAAIAAVLLSGALSAGETFVHTPHASEALPRAKVGFIVTLSGPRASFGQDAVHAAELAAEYQKRAGDPLRFDLVVEDSQGDPREGVNAYQKLKLQGIRFVLTQNSNVSVPISQAVNRDGVVQLAFNTTADKFSTPQDFTFRVNGTTRDEAVVLAEFAEKKVKAHPGALALLSLDDEYPESLRRNVEAEFSRRGLPVALQTTFAPKETDFRALITKLKNLNVRHVVLLGYQTEAGYFVRQQAELQLRPEMILGNSPLYNKEFLDIAGTAAEGVALVYFQFDRALPAATEFETKYGRPLSLAAANAFDAVRIAQIAVTACPRADDPGCLQQALFGVRDFHGLSGTKHVDSVFGDMNDEYTVLTVLHGAYAPVE